MAKRPVPSINLAITVTSYIGLDITSIIIPRFYYNFKYNNWNYNKMITRIGGAVRRQLWEFPQQERTNVPVMLPLMRLMQRRRRTILQAQAKKRDKRSAGDGTPFIPFLGK